MLIFYWVKRNIYKSLNSVMFPIWYISLFFIANVTFKVHCEFGYKEIFNFFYYFFYILNTIIYFF